MTVHQACPFCDRRFEIGPSDYRPMERHILLAHSTPHAVQKTSAR